MRRLICQLPADVVHMLLFFCIFSCNLCYTAMAWGRSWRPNVAIRLIVLTGERANYLSIIAKRCPVFTHFFYYFTLLKAFNTNALHFHQYFKNKLSSHQPFDMHTRHRINSNLKFSLLNHPKTQKCFCTMLFKICNSKPSPLENCTSKFT